MPPRYRISLEQRERIVRAFEDVHEDYLAIAETIEVNRSTARGIVSHYVREGRIAERPRGGANHVGVDDAMRDCLDDIISENCLLKIDLFSLYVLFSHFRPRDATRGNSFFQMSSYARANLRISNEKKQKENSHEGITWSEMGKQNVQAEKVYCRDEPRIETTPST